MLSRTEQRQLLGRWAHPDPEVTPSERLVGLLCLLHGASPAELRGLRVDDVDLATGRLRLGRRPQPMPLDPLTTDAIRAVLAVRHEAGARNPHLIVTRGTRLHDTPCSPAFLSHVLDPAGVNPRLLRQTRLADFAHRADPRLVAAAFGMTEGGALHYVTDAVDNEQLAFSLDV